MNIYILIVFIIIIMIFFLDYKRNMYTENFNPYTSSFCGNCGRRGRFSCSQCADCGYCITEDGRSQCVQGDIRGPLFNLDCDTWIY